MFAEIISQMVVLRPMVGRRGVASVVHMFLLFICHPMILLLLLVLLATCRPGPPVPRRLLLAHARVSRVLPGPDDAWYISYGFGWSTSLRVCLVTRSLLFADPVRGGIVLWLLLGFLRWTVSCCWFLVNDQRLVDVRHDV